MCRSTRIWVWTVSNTPDPMKHILSWEDNTHQLICKLYFFKNPKVHYIFHNSSQMSQFIQVYSFVPPLLRVNINIILPIILRSPKSFVILRLFYQNTRFHGIISHNICSLPSEEIGLILMRFLNSFWKPQFGFLDQKNQNIKR